MTVLVSVCCAHRPLSLFVLLCTSPFVFNTVSLQARYHVPSHVGINRVLFDTFVCVGICACWHVCRRYVHFMPHREAPPWSLLPKTCSGWWGSTNISLCTMLVAAACRRRRDQDVAQSGLWGHSTIIKRCQLTNFFSLIGASSV